ncbi:MAG: RING finger protein [Candidatus Wallacebacter cryptica]|nr:extracellular solute-binding protein [Bacillota bacterium]
MVEKLEVLTEDSRHVGKSCAKCEQKLEIGAEIVECPRCHAVHHADCWKQNGGCGRRGCAQVAKAVVGEKSAGDGPPPPIPPHRILLGLGIVLAVILVSILWPEPPDPAAGRTKIYVLFEASLDEQNELNRIINDFNAESSDIYIELQTSSRSMIENQLVVRMAGGDAPDIFALPYDRYEAMLDQIGAMYQLGDSDNPVYGVQHPSQLRVISIFVHTPHPYEAVEVLRYLLQEMPRRDLTELKEQAHILDPEYMVDVDTFLSLTE